MSQHIINTTADLLEAAAEEIDTNGWCTNVIRNLAGNLCIMGAIHTALYGNINYEYEASDNTAIFIHEASDLFEVELDYVPADWNDTVCQNGFQAAETLRRLSKISREREDSQQC